MERTVPDLLREKALEGVLLRACADAALRDVLLQGTLDGSIDELTGSVGDRLSLAARWTALFAAARGRPTLPETALLPLETVLEQLMAWRVISTECQFIRRRDRREWRVRIAPVGRLLGRVQGAAVCAVRESFHRSQT